MKPIYSAFLFLIFNLPVFAGHYLEFKITGGHLTGGTMKTWYQDKNTRSEMAMKMPGMDEERTIVTLTLSQNPDLIYMLNETAKTYSVMDKSKNKKPTEDHSGDFEFTVIGPEKVNGYNATHVRAKSKKGKAVMDWWVSKDVKGYEEIRSLKTKEIDAAMWLKGLAGKGVDGFPVRMVMSSQENENAKMQMDLVKSEILSVPESKFSLDGYTKSEGNPGMRVEWILKK